MLERIGTCCLQAPSVEPRRVFAAQIDDPVPAFVSEDLCVLPADEPHRVRQPHVIGMRAPDRHAIFGEGQRPVFAERRRTFDQQLERGLFQLDL